MTVVDIAYSPGYLQWQLGEHHPTNPVRAERAVELLIEELPVRGCEVRLHEPAATSTVMLSAIHDIDYVERTLAGTNGEWAGWAEVRPDLGQTAALLCGGTELLAQRILAGQSRIGFNPMGAKHHAHRDHGSGFCVFNDMALAAHVFTQAGCRVAYLDIDGHHGDGVEAMTRDNSTVFTFSVHQSGIFPGTGLTSDPSHHVHNRALPGGSGDHPWLAALAEGIEQAQLFAPDVVLLAIGADAHETDPLTHLQVSLAGYTQAGRLIGDLVASLNRPVLIGGAGGYQPLDLTPRIWATVVTEIASAVSRHVA